MEWASWIARGWCGLAVFVLGGCSPSKGNRAEEVPASGSDRNAHALPADSAEVESLSEAVKSQLSEIGRALVAPDGHALAATGTCSDAVTFTDSRSWTPSPLEAGPPVLVSEWRDPVHKTAPVNTALVSIAPVNIAPVTGRETTTRGSPVELADRLRGWLGLEAAGKDAKVTFKLFGLVREADGGLRTRQRLTARGSRQGMDIQSLLVAEATWSMASSDSPPQLTSFTFPRLVQSTWQRAPQPFLDAADRLLGEAPGWHDQLQIGMNDWVRQIDRALKPDFLGYHGLALGDTNGDGLEDIYFCQPGGLPNLLFEQQPDGTLQDKSAVAGVDWLDNSTGALLVDLDNDGDKDLAVATHRTFIVAENDGAGRFALRLSLDSLALGYSPTAADIDLDGDLDLLVLRYAADSRQAGDFPSPHPFYDARNGGANVLLENRGGFQFVDVTTERGMGVDNNRYSFAAAWEDYDNDGDADVYIANDFGPNQLFRNEGAHFAEVSRPSGTEDWGFGMSATWGDYDRDGFMDLYVSNMFSGAGNLVVPSDGFHPSIPDETRAKYLKMVRGNSLLRNLGNGSFSDVTDPMAEGFGKWAWGAAWADLNNDGWEDIYLGNGYLSQPDREDL